MLIAPEIVIVPIVFGLPAAVVIARMYFKHNEKMAELQRGSGGNPEISQRLERVESSIEAIAVEMERVGEGQRFVTKLLSERKLPGDKT
ncbi:MAG: hypothetical protein H0U64_05435 [Gemmatimonadaceae bacterium]|nr:hypothetical protein [Gemmatimonadaceae bacterium]